MITLLLIILIMMLLLMGMPMFSVLGGITLFCFYFLTDDHTSLSDYQIFIEKIFELTDKNVLLAIPFFIVSGTFMTHGAMSNKLVNIAKSIVGWMPGGLGISTVFACMFFATMSGSSPVTVIAIGGMMFPALVKDHYGEKFSLGLVTSSGSLGILIPPSIPMIIYAVVMSGRFSVDVKDLYIAGILPGLVIVGVLSAYTFFMGIRHNFLTIPFNFHNIYVSFKDGLWATFLPVIILGGIYSGTFTPTEAAAVAVIYSLVVEIYIYKEVKLSDIPQLMTESCIMIGSLLIIMVMAFGFNDFLVIRQVPNMVVEYIESLKLGVIGFLMILNIFLLVVGCFMDIFSAIMIIAGLLAPLAGAMNIDPIHLGMITIVNLEIGYVTPPLGLNLFVSASLFRKSLGKVIISSLPFVIIMLAGLMLITYIPSLSLGPLRLLNGQSFWVPLVKDKNVQQQDSINKPKKLQTLEQMMLEMGMDRDGTEGTQKKKNDKVQTLEDMMKEADQDDMEELEDLEDLEEELEEEDGEDEENLENQDDTEETEEE